MLFPRFALLVATVSLWLNAGLQAQQTAGPVVNNEFVQKQFGSNCALIDVPSLTADLDGDGTQDIVIPARCTSPMMDQAEDGYVVVDPYDAYFGYGNPAITTQFASEDPQRRGFSLLVIHGTGSEAWHSPTPKAKFLIVNLPFKQVYVKKLVVKKKEHMAIYVEEIGAGELTSALFWDGKKYRYQPMGSSME